MNFQPYLVKAIAMEKHFWPDIDKKFIELGLGGMRRTKKTISVINELPPYAFLRALKLLAINDAPEGRIWVAELMHKVFRKEIEKFDELRQNNDISFENFIADTYYSKIPMSALSRKAAIFAALCGAIGKPCNDKFAISLLTDSSSIFQSMPISVEASRMTDEWLKKHDSPMTLNEVSYDDELYPKEYYTYGVVSGSENIPLRAVEEYEFTKDDIRKIVNIALASGEKFDIDKILVHSYIIKSIARYAEECKNAYIDIALSADVATNKIRSIDLKNKQSEIDKLQMRLDKQQQSLNEAQLTIDRQRKKIVADAEGYASQQETISEMKAYIDALELQLENQTEYRQQSDPVVLPDLSNKRIVVVGGHENWQNKLKSLYPDFTFIGADDINFDINVVRNADVVIFNFIHGSHTLYYKLKANRENIVYIGNNSINIFNAALIKSL